MASENLNLNNYFFFSIDITQILALKFLVSKAKFTFLYISFKSFILCGLCLFDFQLFYEQNVLGKENVFVKKVPTYVNSALVEHFHLIWRVF